MSATNCATREARQHRNVGLLRILLAGFQRASKTLAEAEKISSITGAYTNESPRYLRATERTGHMGNTSSFEKGGNDALRKFPSTTSALRQIHRHRQHRTTARSPGHEVFGCPIRDYGLSADHADISTAEIRRLATFTLPTTVSIL